MKVIGLFALVMTGLTGCSLVEPTADINVQTPVALTRKKALDCAITTINQIAKIQAHWKISPLKVDPNLGVLETGNFDESNVLGIRARLIYQPNERRFLGKIKASGIYYSDLGADKAALDLGNGLSKCQ